MKCPNCGNRDKIDVHEADGFCQDTRSCGACGMVWTFREDKQVTLKEGKQILYG